MSYNSFIFIRDKNGEWQHQYLKTYGSMSENISTKKISRDEKIIIFVYQQKVLGDTAVNGLAYTTCDNWEKRLTKDFDTDLIFPLRVSRFTSEKDYLIFLGFKNENIFYEKNKKYTPLGIIQG